MIEAHMTGGRELIAAIERLDIRVDDAVRRAVALGAFEFEGVVRRQFALSHAKGSLTPSMPGSPPAVVTGALRRSIHTEGPVRAGFGIYAAKVGPTVSYSRVQELGGDAGRNHATHLPARPFLRPAYDEWAARGALRDRVVSEIRKALHA